MKTRNIIIAFLVIFIIGQFAFHNGYTPITLTTTGTSGAATWNGTTWTMNIPQYGTGAAPSVTNTAGRSLSTTGSNNTFTISASRPAIVAYTVNFSVALVVAVSNGVVQLDYSVDAGSNWINVSSVSQVFGVSVTITTSGDQVLSGYIPANALVRIYRSANTNCTVTLTTKQQELQVF